MAKKNKQQPGLFDAPNGKRLVCFLPTLETSRRNEILQRIPEEEREAITMEFQVNETRYGQTYEFFVQNPVEIL
jgi:hypothetical protein